MKKWWIFGANFSRFTQSFSRFIRDTNGEKKISLLMIFFTVSFSRFTPSRLVYGEGGRPSYGTSAISLHMFFTKICPAGGTKYVSFELFFFFFFRILRRPGEGSGGAPVRHLCKTYRSLHGRHVWEMPIEQPRLAPASTGCSRAREIFKTLRPSPRKTTCPIGLRGNPGIRALYQAIRFPMLSLMQPFQNKSFVRVVLRVVVLNHFGGKEAFFGVIPGFRVGNLDSQNCLLSSWVVLGPPF